MKWYIALEIGTLALIVQSGMYAADPQALLSQADHLAEIGNSVKARPLYAEAEQEFRSRGDTKKELYAKFGRLHREVESGSYSAISEELERDLANPLVQNDPALKIRALSVKGIIDLNLNTAAALDDFTQIQTLARSIGDRKWENRASGELGIVAGVNGDVGTAAVALLKAIGTAGALKDVAGQISFATWLANGRLQGEEGVMNLARTFLIAGAKSVVASLWDADDRSTATLMAHFYRQIATGKSVAEALRAAQMEMLKEFGADMPPYYWAGFTVIGDGKRQISFTKTRSTVGTTEGVDFR
jgi:hypothetical protein